MLNIKKIRKDFLIDKNIIYFDNASTTQKPKILIKSINNFYNKLNYNINREGCNLNNRTGNLVIKSRRLIKELINAKSIKEIIFTKGATESINLIANSLKIKKKDEISITELEHNSNVIPWILLKKKKKIKLNIIKINKYFNIDLKDLKKKINKRTKILSITHISNSIGNILPIKYIVKIVKKINKKTLILLDSAQSIAHIPIDVIELDIDFLVFSAHKLYGPMGLGILYGKKKILKKMGVYQVGGGMIKGIKNNRIYYLNYPNKFEAGTMNLESIITFIPVIKYLLKIKIVNIYIYERNLLNYAIKKIKKIKLIKIYKNINISILSFNIKKKNNLDICFYLNKYGICVRTGYHCAHLLFNKLKLKEGVIRISLSIYNTYKEIDFFLKKIKKIIKYLN